MSSAAVAEPSTQHIDVVRKDREVDVNESMRLARHRSGVEFATQSKDLLELRRGMGGIEPKEYYFYGLYDREIYDDAARRAFVGRWRVHRLTSGLVEDVFGKTIDKAATQAMLADAGIAVPNTVAVYGGTGELAEATRHLSGVDELRELLRDMPAMGLFGKPVKSVGSLGVLSIDGFDEAEDAVLAGDGRSVALNELIVELKRYENAGYQFQERLRPHPEVEAVLGNRIGTLRVLVVNGDSPEIVRVGWKIPAGDNMADNFWRPGNMLGAVDPMTGVVQRVVDDVYPRLAEVTHHPDSGKPLTGMQLPDWQAMREMVVEASRLWGQLPLLGWDIALTDKGPLAVEVEGNGGHPMMTQLAHGRGLLEEPVFRAALTRIVAEQPSMPLLMWRFIKRKLTGKRTT